MSRFDENYWATSTVSCASNKEVPGAGEDRKSSAIKLDGNKAPLFEAVFSYFPKALKAVAEVSAFGAKKYNQSTFPTKWKEVPNGLTRYGNALGRHLVDEADGELYASDSGLLHAAHAAWNSLARLELLIEQENTKRLKEEEYLKNAKYNAQATIEHVLGTQNRA